MENKTTFALESQPTRHPDVFTSMTGDEAVLVLPQRGQVKVLNQVGAFLWELLDGQHTVADLVEQLCQSFEVDEQTAQADILAFLKDLEARDLLASTQIVSKE